MCCELMRRIMSVPLFWKTGVPITALVGACLTLSACDKPESSAIANNVSDAKVAAPVIPDGASYFYDGEMRVDPESHQVDLTWDLTLQHAGETQISYLLNGEFENITVTGPDITDVQIEPSEFFLNEASLVTVSFNPEAEGPYQFNIAYSGQFLDEGIDPPINSISSSKIELTVDSLWLPFDTRFSERLVAEVDVFVDGDWSGVTNGQVEEIDGGLRFILDRPNLDIPIILMSDYRQTESGDYKIYDTREGEYDLAPLADMAGYCTNYLNELYGDPVPLPGASIVINQREDSGYARQSLIALTDIGEEYDADLLQFVCHELAHFWSLKGNPSTVENWLNESFADYVANMAVREREGEDAFEARMARYAARVESQDLPPIWTEGQTTRPPYAVSYRKGPLAIQYLEELAGREVFAEIMRRYMVETIDTTPKLLDIVEQEAGPEIRQAFQDRLAE